MLSEHMSLKLPFVNLLGILVNEYDIRMNSKFCETVLNFLYPRKDLAIVISKATFVVV